MTTRAGVGFVARALGVTRRRRCVAGPRRPLRRVRRPRRRHPRATACSSRLVAGLLGGAHAPGARRCPVAARHGVSLGAPRAGRRRRPPRPSSLLAGAAVADERTAALGPGVLPASTGSELAAEVVLLEPIRVAGERLGGRRACGSSARERAVRGSAGAALGCAGRRRAGGRRSLDGAPRPVRTGRMPAGATVGAVLRAVRRAVGDVLRVRARAPARARRRVSAPSRRARRARSSRLGGHRRGARRARRASSTPRASARRARSARAWRAARPHCCAAWCSVRTRRSAGDARRRSSGRVSRT